MPTVELRVQPVELHKLLKFAGLASSGGEAKALIADGLVKVNGEAETRKRKKIVSGDLVEFAGDRYVVTLQSDQGTDSGTEKQNSAPP